MKSSVHTDRQTELGTEQPVHKERGKVKPVGHNARAGSTPALSTSFEVNLASVMEAFWGQLRPRVVTSVLSFRTVPTGAENPLMKVLPGLY